MEPIRDFLDKALCRRTLIMGVGNRLRADDGFGSILVEKLFGKVHAELLDASDVPENYIGVIEKAAPELIILIDAVEMGINPGDVALLEFEQISEMSISTHNASLKLLFSIINVPEVIIMAVQPKTTAFGQPLSTEVQLAIDTLVDLFSKTG